MFYFVMERKTPNAADLAYSIWIHTLDEGKSLYSEPADTSISSYRQTWVLFNTMENDPLASFYVSKPLVTVKSVLTQFHSTCRRLDTWRLKKKCKRNLPAKWFKSAHREKCGLKGPFLRPYWQFHPIWPGVRFSKDPKTLRARKPIRKTPTRLLCNSGRFICCKGNKN